MNTYDASETDGGHPQSRLEQERECGRRYREKYPDRVREACRRYRAEHLEQERERSRRYVAEHREQARETSRIWRQEHPEGAREQRRKWWEKNPGYYREYCQAHPEETRGRCQRHRALKRGCAVSLTGAEWRTIKEVYGNRCVYCGKKAKRMTQDHVIPFARGGSHAADNVVPACLRCNLVKHTSPPPPFQRALIGMFVEDSSQKGIRK
jgi:hypothetical protein